MLKEDCKKYCAEMFGTAVLVFVAIGVAVFTWPILGGSSLIATALAFGLVIVAMAYSIGHISGAHLNPAVSFGAFLRKKLDAKDFGFYVLAQVIGAIVGAALLFFIVKLMDMDVAVSMGANGYKGIAATSSAAQIVVALIIEIVLTFIFVLTILGVTSKKANALVAGLVIGLTLTLVHLIGIPFTGTSVNPARSIGPALFAGKLALEQLWLFIVAPLVGGALAALAACALFKDEDETTAVNKSADGMRKAGK